MYILGEWYFSGLRPIMGVAIPAEWAEFQTNFSYGATKPYSGGYTSGFV